MLMDEWQKPFTKAIVDVDVRVDGWRVLAAEERPRHAELRNYDPHQDLGRILGCLNKANVFRTLLLVFSIESSISWHLASRKRKVLLVVQDYLAPTVSYKLK